MKFTAAGGEVQRIHRLNEASISPSNDWWNHEYRNKQRTIIPRFELTVNGKWHLFNRWNKTVCGCKPIRYWRIKKEEKMYSRPTKNVCKLCVNHQRILYARIRKRVEKP